MTITEVSELTEIDLDLIQYYEGEGFIKPERLENGYRDYTSKEVDMLLKIKLLRTIHISVDRIKGLMMGHEDLMTILSKHLEDNEEKVKSSPKVKKICRQLLEEQVSFDNLDPQKYLAINLLAADIMDEEVEVSHVYYPWRRYFARTLDIFIYSTLISVVKALVFRVNIANGDNLTAIIDMFFSMGVMLLVEPLLLNKFGTTIGKAVFGLRLQVASGRNLYYKEGLSRTWRVIGQGLGYNIPIYSLVRLVKSYNICKSEEPFSWDKNISYTIKDTKWYRTVAFLALNGLMFFLIILTVLFQQLPPNRGDLTVAEFSENYNYYISLLDVEFRNSYLDENGKWQEHPQENNTIYFNIGEELPEIHFGMEGENIKSVSFMVEKENTKEWVQSYDLQMLLMSFSYVGAQEGVGIFNNVNDRIARNLVNQSFQGFHFEEEGIEVICNTEYSGFEGANAMYLFPKDDNSENHFYFEFIMNKVN